MYHRYTISVNIFGNFISRQVSQNPSLTKSSAAILPINHLGQKSLWGKLMRGTGYLSKTETQAPPVWSSERLSNIDKRQTNPGCLLLPLRGWEAFWLECTNSTAPWNTSRRWNKSVSLLKWDPSSSEFILDSTEASANTCTLTSETNHLSSQSKTRVQTNMRA